MFFSFYLLRRFLSPFLRLVFFLLPCTFSCISFLFFKRFFPLLLLNFLIFLLFILSFYFIILSSIFLFFFSFFCFPLCIWLRFELTTSCGAWTGYGTKYTVAGRKKESMKVESTVLAGQRETTYHEERKRGQTHTLNQTKMLIFEKNLNKKQFSKHFLKFCKFTANTLYFKIKFRTQITSHTFETERYKR